MPDKSFELPSIQAPTEPAQDAPEPDSPAKRVGFAIVGLGDLTLKNILPAFSRSLHARPAALVSGSKAKASAVADRYGIPEHIYDYKSFDRIADDESIEVVYIVLPNSMHREFTERAAAAGKHVLCEKPMATNVADAEAMIAACKQADRKLMIAYRTQYEPNNRAMIELCRSAEFGAIRTIVADNGQNQSHVPQWRFDKALAGGGSLPDVGIYCLSACRFITGEEPDRVYGLTSSPAGDDRFKQVEASCNFMLHFPSGTIANCSSGYDHHKTGRYRVFGETTWAEMDPGFPYVGLRMRYGRKQGEVDTVFEPHRAEKDQFALELDHMADCVRHNKTPHTPGEEGLQDQKIVEAIYASAASGKAVELPNLSGRGRDLFRGKW